MTRLLSAAALTGIMLCAAGCTDAPLHVQTIQVGRSLNPDRSVASPTTLFKPHETIYVAVLTSDTGAGTIKVRWMYGSRVVDEPVKKVSYKGASATEFHIQSAGGFPVGDYSVEAFIDNVSVGRRVFKVEDRK